MKEDSLNLHGALIHCTSTDRKHATALNGTRRDEATLSIFGYSMGLELSQLGQWDGTRGRRNSAVLCAEDERDAKRKTTRDICHQKGTGNNGTNGRLLLYVRGNV